MENGSGSKPNARVRSSAACCGARKNGRGRKHAHTTENICSGAALYLSRNAIVAFTATVTTDIVSLITRGFTTTLYCANSCPASGTSATSGAIPDASSDPDTRSILQSEVYSRSR